MSVKCGFDFILFFTLPTPCNLQLENVVTLKPPQTFLRQNANSSFFYEYAKSIEMDEPHLIFRKGASIKYVRRFSGILDPLPPLVRFSRNLSVLSYAKIGHFFDTPPSPSARMYFMDAPLLNLISLSASGAGPLLFGQVRVVVF